MSDTNVWQKGHVGSPDDVPAKQVVAEVEEVKEPEVGEVSIPDVEDTTVSEPESEAESSEEAADQLDPDEDEAEAVDYSEHTVAELKSLLHERELTVSGNKKELIERLEEDDAKKA